MSDLDGDDGPIVTPVKRTRRHVTQAAAAAPAPPTAAGVTSTNTTTTNTSMSEDEQADPPAFSLSALGLQRVGTAAPPRPQPQQPVQTLNARGMPARIRKRNRLFYDDDIINDDKPLRMSLSPRKTPLKGASSSHGGGGGGVSSPSSTKTTPTKQLKSRKVIGGGTRYLRSEEKRRAGSGGGAGGGDDDFPTTPTRSSHASDSANTTPKSSGHQRGHATQPNTPSSGGGGAASGGAGGVYKHIIPADKKLGQRIGLRLRNLLKLPKANKWVIYEWFYSFVDKPLFEGENDFQVCLNESFPQLRTRQLNRAEWRRIRALMGKPRRCSQAFFEEERRELERKRQKIRYMQTRKSGDIKDLSFVRDLPDKIPLPLPVGTRVTARLRLPSDGIFNGTVDAFDSLTSMYRVTFEREGLGTHSIPDFEIVSENFHEMLPLQTFTKDFRPNLMSVYNGCVNSPLKGGAHAAAARGGVRTGPSMNLNKSDPLLGQLFLETPFQNPVLGNEHINGYPTKLLETLVRIKRALNIKQSKLQRLRDMNNEAEVKVSQQPSSLGGGAHHNSSASSSDESQSMPESAPQLTEEFQRRYASIVISMEKMNRDIQDYLNEIQPYASDLTRDPQVQAMLAPSYLREKCREAAEYAVQRNNQGLLKNNGVLALIKNLATVLLVASHLSNDGNSAQVTKVLEGCIEEVKSGLYGVNVETFQKHVQIHLHHIRLGIGQSMLPPAVGSTSAMSAGGGGGIDR